MPRYSQQGEPQRGQRGFSTYSGQASRGDKGFNEYPSQARALSDAYERERLIAMDEKEEQRAYNEEYGPRYFDLVENMDVSDPEFESTLRSFDYKSKKIPGFIDAVNNKKAERKEWVDADNARIELENDKITANNQILEDNQKETDAFDDKQIASLSPSQQRAFKIARQNGDVDTQNDLLGRAYELGDKKFTDAAAKVKADADKAEYGAETTRRTQGNATLTKQLAGIDKTLAPLEKREKEIAEWKLFDEAKIEAKNKNGTFAPTNLTATEKAQLEKGRNERSALTEQIGDGQLLVDQRNFQSGGKEKDSMMSKLTDQDKVTNSPYDVNEFNKDSLGHLERVGKEDNNRLSQLQNRGEAADKALKEAQAKSEEFNRKVLETDSDSFTDEEFEQYTSLNNSVEDLTMRRAEIDEQLQATSQRIEQSEAASQQLKGQVDQFSEDRYNSMLADNGEFQNNTDESKFNSVYNAYARDNDLSLDPDKTKAPYDFRRAYAEGDLKIDSEGELPPKWRKEGHPKLYKHATRDLYSPRPIEGYIDTRNGKVVDNEEDVPEGQAAASSLDS